MDKKVCISFIGGEIPPVINLIQKIEDVHLVFVYSDDSKKKLDEVIEKLKELKNPYVDDCESFCSDPFDFKQAHDTIFELRDKFKGRKVFVNITCGPKTWAIFAYQVFAQVTNANLLYVDQKTNHVWNVKSGIHKRLPDCGFGKTPAFYYPIDEYYNGEDDDVLAKIQSIRSINKHAFSEMTKDVAISSLPPNVDNWQGLSCGASFIKYDYEQKAYLAHIVADKKSRDFVLKSPMVNNLLFNTGWYEYKIAKLISLWSEASNIWLNNKWYAPGEDARYRDLVLSGASEKELEGCRISNEVDITFNAKGLQFFVEVKTFARKSTDFNKFNDVCKLYGSSAVRKLFVTDADLDGRDLQPELNDVLNKCEANGITVFSTYQYKFHSSKKLELDFIQMLEQLSEKTNL